MKIKKGDTVKMIKGKDRGKTGKVLRVLTKEHRAVVEGLNLITKHQRPKREGEKGQKLQFPRPVFAANMMVVCTKCNRPARLGYRILADGAKERMCKKCKESI